MNNLDHQKQPPATRTRPSLLRPLILLLALAAVGSLALFFDLGAKFKDLREWIVSLGPLGPFVFIALYAAAVVAAVPGSAITFLAGALFGSWIGIAVVSAGATVGATLAFLASRYFARDTVMHWISGNERFRQLDAMTESHGAIIVALTRLVPLFPFNLLNYGFGLTRVRFWTYVFWSWLCMLPATVVIVVGGDAVTQALTQGEIPWLLVIVAAGAALGLTLLVRFARRRLKAKEEGTSHA